MAWLAAAGPLSRPLELLRNLIADSPTWQALVADPEALWEDILDAADDLRDTPDSEARDAALARILGDSIYEDANYNEATSTPFIWIRFLPEGGLLQSSNSTWHGEVSLLMEIHLEVPADYRAYTREAIWNGTIDFQNKISAIIEDMQTANVQAADADRLNPFDVQLGPTGMFDVRENNNRWERKWELAITGEL